MNPELMARVNQTWAAHFDLPLTLLSIPGTTLRVNDQWAADSDLVFWQVGEQIVLEVPRAAEVEARQLVAQFSDDHCIEPADFRSVWGDVEQSAMPMYALDAALFRPAAVQPPYEMRQLTPDDQPAFDLFLNQCSEADKDEGDVGIDHMIAFGIFDGARIVGASSVFVWRGFIDIGILTDPAYRGKGFGKALVSACVAQHLNGEQVVGYRHAEENLASRGIAQALGFSPYAVVQMIRRPAG